LSKLDVYQKITVDLKMDELDVTAAENKATYEEIREYVKEHTGLNVSNLYIAQVKRKCGIKERQNYNKPKAENPKQLKCPPEKEKAIREALKYFMIICYDRSSSSNAVHPSSTSRHVASKSPVNHGSATSRGWSVCAISSETLCCGSPPTIRRMSHRLLSSMPIR
jgi:hypothetical protein